MKKQEDINYFEHIVAFALGIMLSIFVTFYEVYVLMKFVKWYNVPLSLTFKQWFGAIAILTVLSFGWKKSDSDKDKSIWYKMINPSCVSVFLLSFVLLIYYILKFFI